MGADSETLNHASIGDAVRSRIAKVGRDRPEAETQADLDALNQWTPAPALVADPINHPAHYTASPYESITVIEAVGSGFCRGNALKYLCRAPHKGQLAADLRKAAWYVRRLVTSREAFKPMTRANALPIAKSWDDREGIRWGVILYLLMGDKDLDLAALADDLEKEADREDP